MVDSEAHKLEQLESHVICTALLCNRKLEQTEKQNDEQIDQCGMAYSKMA